MRILVLLMSLAMPFVAWLSQRGSFGPTNGAISDQYPTLLVAAGYAFSIWALIFLLDLVFGIWQLRVPREQDATLRRIRPAAALGFALTAAWMPIFSMQYFALSLVVIWASLACLLYCAVVLSRDARPARWQDTWAWLPLSLHAGWLTLAAFLNTAQVIVAHQLLSTTVQLPWSIVLLAIATALLLVANVRMRGNVAYAAAALWALAAVYAKQSESTMAGSNIAAWSALAIGAALLVQTIALRLRRGSPT